MSFSNLLFSHYIPVNHPYLTDITQLDPSKVHSFKHSFDRQGIRNINDQFAVGGYNAMKTYHNFFPHLINYYFRDSKYKQFMNDIDASHLYVETSLLQHLRDNDIQTSPEQEINLHEVMLGSNYTHSYDTPRIMR